jgi:hypothetical protein
MRSKGKWLRYFDRRKRRKLSLKIYLQFLKLK